jgi:hypothetical protein
MFYIRCLLMTSIKIRKDVEIIEEIVGKVTDLDLEDHPKKTIFHPKIDVQMSLR